ncbi:ATP-binding protein [Algoriphagus ratkowskyi]
MIHTLLYVTIPIDEERIDFMEMIEDRHVKKSMIIVSQLPVSSWNDIIGEEIVADAVLDRLVHSC